MIFFESEWPHIQTSSGGCRGKTNPAPAGVGAGSTKNHRVKPGFIR